MSVDPADGQWCELLIDRIDHGTVDEAFETFAEVLARHEEAFGKISNEVANVMSCMGGFLVVRKGDWDRAAPLWWNAIELLEVLYAQRKQLDEDSVRDIARAFRGILENLASYAFRQGRYSDAEVLFERAMEVLRECLNSSSLCNTDTYLKVKVKSNT